MPTTSTGFSPFVFVPFALFGLLFYGVIFFCVWKFYQMLSKINDNLAGINSNVAGIRSERNSVPILSGTAKLDTRTLKAQQCPTCGLTVLPTAEGRCPSCQASII